MTPSICIIFWENLLDLEKIQAQFVNRLTQLTDAAVHSAEERAARLNTHCSVPALTNHSNLSSYEGFFALADAQAKIFTECGEACIEETRNVAQITMLTQDEMRVWADRWFKGWTEFVTSATLSSAKHEQSRSTVG